MTPLLPHNHNVTHQSYSKAVFVAGDAPYPLKAMGICRLPHTGPALSRGPTVRTTV